MKYLYLSLILVFLTGIYSCMDDFRAIKSIKGFKIKDENYQPTLEIPLLHANLDFMDVIRERNQDSIIKIQPDSFVWFIYPGRPYTAWARNYIIIHDQTLKAGPYTYTIPGKDSSLINQDLIIDKQIDQPFVFYNNEQIVLLKLKSGMLNLSFSSTFRRSGSVKISIPEAKKGSVSFDTTINFTYNNSTPVTFSNQIDLSGYTFDLSKGGTTFNKIAVNYHFVFLNSLKYIRKADAVQLNATITNPKFSYIQGYLGPHNYLYTVDTILISIFNDLNGGKIHLADPRLYVNIKNSIGIPVKVTPEQLGVRFESNPKVDITGSIMSGPIYIGYPKINEVGKTISTQISANKSNSNIVAAFDESPNKMYYDFDLAANYGGIDYNNFATDSSNLQISVDLDIPLYGSTWNWKFDEKGKLDMPNTENVEKLQFNLLITNGFPILTKAQLYFTDSADNIIDSLVMDQNHVMNSGILDTKAKVVEPGITLTTTIYDKDRIDKLANVKKYRLTVYLATTDDGKKDVKIYSNYTLDIKLSAKATLKFRI